MRKTPLWPDHAILAVLGPATAEWSHRLRAGVRQPHRRGRAGYCLARHLPRLKAPRGAKLPQDLFALMLAPLWSERTSPCHGVPPAAELRESAETGLPLCPSV